MKQDFSEKQTKLLFQFMPRMISCLFLLMIAVGGLNGL